MTVLFLAVRMMHGFGVSVVVAELARRLQAAGEVVVIGCQQHDDAFEGLDIRTVAPDSRAVEALARATGADTVVAHSTPYVEIMPGLPASRCRMVWDHGEPPAALFEDDMPVRAALAARKRAQVYPAVDGVIAISRFVARDIGWPAARVIWNGCDHVEDRGPKDAAAPPGGRLRVGTLLRMGSGEARYKGNALLLGLVRAAAGQGIAADFAVAGRGAPVDAAGFALAGMEVRLNLTDPERADFLRGLDVFVSPSLWEGFNLPLVEAQALGTVGVAFDTGAHPEVTPLVAAGPQDLLALLAAYAADRRLLQDHARRAHRFVRDRFRWDQAVADFREERARLRH
ncbi:glycosyltransferase [Dankookia rubra]|uniref:Glycosyltransferase n=1 Tax=Dankookia rubra TaxID=1442381 RepID=A0A4R5Q4B8_9PROT|nr:glycosyltransferase family 4 protein [Dankookia rubra]TDH57263.1 glycosyltransferase [Dankookia rubra]